MTPVDMTTKVRLVISEEAAFEAELAAATRKILSDPEVNREFPGGDLWMVGYDVAGKGDEHRYFSAIVADMASGRQIEVRGDLDEPENWWLRHLAGQRAPSDDEFSWATRVLAEHHGTDESKEEPYRPMPPLGPLTRPDGSADRVVAVGLRSPDGSHRIVGLRGVDGEVLHNLAHAPVASASEWGLPVGEPAPGIVGASHARVQVWSTDEAEPAVPLWDLVVVRPSASSGLNGAGVELRSVDYLGRRVLHRAQMPILSLAIDSGPSAPPLAYRSWLNHEAGFHAEGTDPVPGFRLCGEAPTTALDGGTGGGPFQGVALFVDGADLVITTQLQAGWYRYLSEWRLSADGAIRPRFGVALTTNPSPVRHVHHAYWRLDFDILGDVENLVQEYNDPAVIGEARWHTVNHEVRRERDSDSGRYWRVRNVRSAATYSLVPGPADGTADSADPTAAGDVWALRFHEDEVDDGQGFTADPVLARAQLDRLVSGEPLRREDVVVWYAAHVAVDPTTGPMSQRVGPDLLPGHWVRGDTGDVFGHVDSSDSYRP